jgi:predicted acylesterase/phospholipase RssA
MEQGTDKRMGLACAGGVVEGAIYEIGALCALEEAIEGLDFTKMDVYVGVSSGSIITACLANRVTARTLSRAIISEADPELNIRPEMFFEPALGEFGRRLGRLPKTLWRALNRYLTNPRDLSLFSIFASLGPIIPAGFFDNRHIRSYLARAFSMGGRTDDFRDLRAELRVIAVDLDSADIVCFGDEAHADVPISKAVQASTALPGMYSPVRIDDTYYIDGVARRTVHASTALEEGVRLLFCINPIVPVNIHLNERELAETVGFSEDHLVNHGLAAVLSQTFRTLVFSRMRAGFRVYEHRYPDADVILVEPKFDDYDMFFSNLFSFSNRQAVCEHAYERTRAFLLENAEDLAPRLARHGLRLRRDVLEDASRRLYAEPPAALMTGSPTLREADRVLTRLDEVLERLRARAA